MILVPSHMRDKYFYAVVQYRIVDNQHRMIHIQVKDVLDGNRTWGHACDARIVSNNTVAKCCFAAKSLNSTNTSYRIAHMRPLPMDFQWRMYTPISDNRILGQNIRLIDQMDHETLLRQFRLAEASMK